MSETECEQAYDQLVLAINDVGLLWLTNQVAEEIRFGRTVTKQVAARPDIPEDLLFEGLAEGHRKSKVSVSATRPYTSREKLGVLLDALEQTIVATHDMEAAVTHYVSKTAANWISILLVRTDEIAREPIQVGRQPDEKRSENISTLRRLIKSLRESM
jgi:hypothetical protein